MGAAAPVQDGALDAQVLGSPRQEVEATGLQVPLDRANLLNTHRNTECKQTRNAARRQITPRNTHFCGSRRCITKSCLAFYQLRQATALVSIGSQYAQAGAELPLWEHFL
jgi:hypothetical protein